jgi:hypothetical protein
LTIAGGTRYWHGRVGGYFLKVGPCADVRRGGPMDSNSNLIDVESMMATASPGAMIFGRVIADPATGWQTGLFIREDRDHIDRLGKNPVVELRAGLMVEGRLGLVAVMARVNGRDLYESWWNYHAPGNRACFADLAGATTLPILFYTRRRERVIGVACLPLAAFFQTATKRLEAMRPWAMADFDRARERVYQRYPDPETLWAALAQEGEGRP